MVNLHRHLPPTKYGKAMNVNNKTSLQDLYSIGSCSYIVLFNGKERRANGNEIKKEFLMHNLDANIIDTTDAARFSALTLDTNLYQAYLDDTALPPSCRKFLKDWPLAASKAKAR